LWLNFFVGVLFFFRTYKIWQNLHQSCSSAYCVHLPQGFVQKLLGQLKFSQCFAQPVNMKKVKLDTCKVWVAQRLISILGVEDEVLTSLVFNHLEAEKVDPKMMQLELTGFLGRNTGPFMEDLWKLLLSAQASPLGIPAEILEQKRAEIQKAQAQAEEAAEILRRRLKGIARESDHVGKRTTHSAERGNSPDAKRSRSPARIREKKRSLWDASDAVRQEMPGKASSNEPAANSSKVSKGHEDPEKAHKKHRRD